MAKSIALKNTLTGVTKNYKLAWFDWEKFTNLGFTAGTGDIVNVPDITDPHKTWYALDDFAPEIGGQNLLGLMLTYTVFRNTTDNLVYIGTTAGDNKFHVEKYWLDNYSQSGGALPFAGYNTPTYWTNVYNTPDQATVITRTSNTYQPTKIYYGNEHAAGHFQTSAGGSVGVSIGMTQGSDNQVGYLACVGAKQIDWSKGFWQQDAFSDLNDWQPKFNGVGCVSMEYHPTRNYATSPVSYNGGSLLSTKLETPDRFITQCVMTKIEGYFYIGMATILTDLDGNPIRISVYFLPSWFWGGVSGNWDVDDEIPEQGDSYNGPQQTPYNVEGTYKISQQPPGAAGGDAAILPFADVSNTEGGMHVYVINAPVMKLLYQDFWGSHTDVSKMLPGIIAFGMIPESLVPTVSDATKVFTVNYAHYGLAYDPQFGGRADHVNGQCVSYYTPTFAGREHIFDINHGLERIWGNYLDFEPYTNITLKVPFCGTIDIPASKCIGGFIDIQFCCYVPTGDVICTIKCTSAKPVLNSDDEDGVPLETTYYLQGNCWVDCPICATTNGVVEKLAGVKVVADAATRVFALTHGGPIGKSVVSQNTMRQLTGGAEDIANIGNVMKPAVDMVGGTPNANFIANKQVVLEVTRPSELADPDYKAISGTQTRRSLRLGDLNGYTVCSGILRTSYNAGEETVVDMFPGAPSELSEIKTLLEGGVVL